MVKSPSKTESQTSQVEDGSLLSVLRKLPVFKGITVEILTSLLESASERLVLHGDYVFRQGEAGRSLVILSKGLAVEFKRCGETDCLLNYYDEPAVVGESSFLESSNRTTSLYANNDCVVTEIDNKHFKELASTAPNQYEALYINLGRELGKKVSNMNAKLCQANQISFIRESSLCWFNY